jgi:hypothetical protein
LIQTLLADPPYLTTLTLSGRTSEMKAREQFVQEAAAEIATAVNRPQKLSRAAKVSTARVNCGSGCAMHLACWIFGL